MDYRDYIKEECLDVYKQEQENLANRLLEAKYNLLFLKMVNERDETFRDNHDITERFEIRIVVRRIYVTVAWELALQIKAFTDDNDKDCLTINKFKNNIYKFIRDDKKQEYFDSLGVITRSHEWSDCTKLVANISAYRNKIVGHNIVNPPKLTFNINDADFVISQYEKVFKVLSFQDKVYEKRVASMDDEMTSFITAYLNAILPLN